MCRKRLVLGEYTVDGSAELGELSLCGDLAEDLVEGEVRADALPDGPATHFRAEGDNFPGHVRARHNVVLDFEGVGVRCYHEVAALSGQIGIRLSEACYRRERGGGPDGEGDIWRRQPHLERDSMGLDEDLRGLQLWNRGGGKGEVVEAVHLRPAKSCQKGAGSGESLSWRSYLPLGGDTREWSVG